MKIILCHNFYRQPGGEDRVLADEEALLRDYGHEVIRFSRNSGDIRGEGNLRLAVGTIWNRTAAAELRELAEREKADIVHFHNIVPLISPAAYYAARQAGAAVVQTLHNYRLMCPAATLCRENRPCRKCVNKIFPWPAIRYKCYRGSLGGSIALASMLTVHRACGTWTRAVDRYIALTQGARQRFIDGGLPAGRVVVKPNFVYPDPGPGTGAGRYAVFVGRLSHEKGIDTLLQAWPLVSSPLRLRIVGDGPLRDRVCAAAQLDDRIEWMGWKDPAEVLDLVGNAGCLIMPSVWVEGFPRSLVEAMAKGTPMIVSRLGAMAELVEDRRTGLHFEAGNASDLAGTVERFFSNITNIGAMRSNVRGEFEVHYTAEANYHSLCSIYEDAIGTHATPGSRRAPNSCCSVE